MGFLEPLLIRRDGHLLELSGSDGRAPDAVRQVFDNNFSYWHKYTDGRTKAVQVVRRKLYRIGPLGQIVCGLGLQYRLFEILQEMGILYQVHDVDDPLRRPAPQCYQLHLDDLFDGISFRDQLQENCFLAIMGRDHGLIDSKPGFGKTWMFGLLGKVYRSAKIHLIVRGIDIGKHIQDDARRFIPRVGMVGGGHNDWQRVTVVSADSLHKVDYDDPASERFAHIVLADEVDRLATDEYLSYLQRYNYARMYGFTGTLGMRFDGADAALESIFGRVIFKSSYQENQQAGLVTPIQVEWLDTASCAVELDEENTNQVAIYRHLIWTNRNRCAIFADRLKQFEADDQALVLVDKVQHALCFKKLLPDYVLVYGEASMEEDRYAAAVKKGLIDPHAEPLVTKKRRNELRKRFEQGELKKVIATGVWQTGVSFDSLAILANAAALGSERAANQGPCRANRIHEASGKAVANVLDANDSFSTSFKDKAKERYRSYARNGWLQTGALPVAPRKRRASEATHG